jgi:hypothetical protein
MNDIIKWKIKIWKAYKEGIDSLVVLYETLEKDSDISKVAKNTVEVYLSEVIEGAIDERFGCCAFGQLPH